jgi:hypothetical protein
LIALWVTNFCVLASIFRQKRKEFLVALLMTWWDLGRAVLAFWAGMFHFVFVFFMYLYAVARLAVLGVWTLLTDLFLLPLRVIRAIGDNMLSPGTPWIAVALTVFWSLLEATIFTYVTTPLVLDTFSNMTGKDLTEAMVRVPLFLFLLFIVLGSYAVLSTWTENMKAKNIGGMIKIGLIEVVVLFVEVMFLYREFVDALVPWFAQHSGGKFEMGIVGTLSIAGLAWFGVRGVSWFLFASHGTPTLMSMIRGAGVQSGKKGEKPKEEAEALAITLAFVQQIRDELGELKKQGEAVIGAFIIPPMQVIGAAINFLTLAIAAQHLFDLPFKSIDEMAHSRTRLHTVSRAKLTTSPGEE